MKLFKHQEEGIAFLREHPCAILADEMGLGKTRQAIMAIGDTEENGTIVVCPASLKENWRREILMVYSEDEISVVGTGPQYTLPEAPWIVINYDMLPKYLTQLKDRIEEGKIGSVIVDEAHYIKGRTSERSEATLKLVADAKRVVLLTGTPLLNRPAELFNLLKAVKHPLGKAKTVFAKRYCGGQMKAMVRDLFANKQFFVDPKKQWPFRAKKDRYRVYVFMDDTGATHLEELRRATSNVMLRRTKAEVLDLPEKIIADVEFEMTSEWRTKYNTAWDTYLLWLETHPDAGRNLDNVLTAQQLVEIGKLKQVCSLAKVERIAADVENIVEQGSKVIIFSQYTATIDALAHEMYKRKIGCARLTGQSDQSERQIAVDDFQKTEACKAFVANITAGGVGINLTAASVVIFADLDWSPGVNAQAEDRAHRIGQEGTINVYRYVAKETMEADILKLLETKKGVIDTVV